MRPVKGKCLARLEELRPAFPVRHRQETSPNGQSLRTGFEQRKACPGRSPSISLIFGMMICASASAAPQIKLDQEFISFGTLKSKTEVMNPRIVRVQNLGDSDLVIKRIEVGCGCIKAKLLGCRNVPSASDVTIQLDFDPSRAVVGGRTFDLVIMSNDLDTPQLSIPVVYNYEPPVVIVPKAIEIYGDTGRDNSWLGVGSGKITIYHRSAHDLSILDLSSSNLFLEYTVLDVKYTDTKLDTIHTITIRGVLAPGWPIGPVDESLTLTTNYAGYERIVIPVRGHVVGPVRVRPGVVRLEKLKRGETFSRDIVLSAENDIVIDKVLSSYDNLIKVTGTGAVGKTIVLSISATVPADYKNPPDDYFWEDIDIHMAKPRKYVQVIRVWGVLE